MLALDFKPEDCVFVYFRDQPVGAIRIGAVRPRQASSRVKLLFAGAERDFQILRPNAVIGRYGLRELEKLIERFRLS